MWVFLVVALTTLALLALIVAFLVSLVSAAVLATVFLSLHRWYGAVRYGAGRRDQRSKRLA